LNNDDMILISVDDHIIEPPDMFRNHLPDKYKLDAPRMVHKYGLEPQGLDEIRTGCYNVDERIKDMNAGGVTTRATPQRNLPAFRISSPQQAHS
jgi:hypothetical protein